MLALAMLLLGLGCVTRESGVPSAVVPFTVGRTTFREAVAAWGNPDSIKGDTAIWKLTTANGGRLKAGYMMMGVTVSSSRLATREYRLAFDGGGVLKSLQTADSVPDGAVWTLCPW